MWHKDDDSYVEYLSDEECFRNGVRLEETMHTAYLGHSNGGAIIYDQGGRTLVSWMSFVIPLMDIDQIPLILVVVWMILMINHDDKYDNDDSWWSSQLWLISD